MASSTLADSSFGTHSTGQMIIYIKQFFLFYGHNPFKILTLLYKNVTLLAVVPSCSITLCTLVIWYKKRDTFAECDFTICQI